MPYRIKGWGQHFEVAQSRKVEGPLPWFRCPTDFSATGYCRLMSHERGAAHYGVWIALLALAARQPRERRTGALTDDVGMLAVRIRMPVEVVREALDQLLEVGWLESETHSATTPLPPRSHSSGRRRDERRQEGGALPPGQQARPPRERKPIPARGADVAVPAPADPEGAAPAPPNRSPAQLPGGVRGFKPHEHVVLRVDGGTVRFQIGGQGGYGDRTGVYEYRGEDRTPHRVWRPDRPREGGEFRGEGAA